MLEILTPLTKVERVSRSIDPATFVAQPGTWAYLAADGSLINVPTGVNNLINKLVIGSASSNKYESHDVEVGRITTMESHGVRIKVDSIGFTGTPSIGDELVVNSASGKEGKLVSLGQSPIGTYEVVARCEETNFASGYIIYRTLSPYIAENASSASASASPSASSSPSSSESSSVSQSASASPSSSESSSVSQSASESPSASASPS